MITFLVILTTIISLRTIYLSKIKYGFLLNHYTLHNVFWLFTIILSYYFNNFYVTVNNEIFYIFIFGLIFFNFTINFVPTYRMRLSKPVLLSIRKRRIIELIIIAFTIPQAILNYKLIQQGIPLWAINAEYWSNRGGSIYIYALFQQSIISPVSQLLIATCFFNNYYDSKKKSFYITILIALLLEAISLLSSGGGRTGMLHLGFMLFLAYGASYNPYIKKSVAQINKYIFLSVVLICIIGVSWATINRGHESIFQEIIHRYTLCVPLFEHYYESDILKHHTFGSSTFEFFVTLFNYPFRLLGLGFDIVYNNSIIQEPVYLPALADETNAYVTEYFNYIRDWGIVGVMIGPMFLAYMYNLAYKYLRKNSFYMLFFLAGVLSWNFESHFAFLKNNCLSIMYCIVLYKFLKK